MVGKACPLCRVNKRWAQSALPPDDALPLARTEHLKLNAFHLLCSQALYSAQAGVRARKSLHAFIITACCPLFLILLPPYCRHGPDSRQTVNHQVCTALVSPNILMPATKNQVKGCQRNNLSSWLFPLPASEPGT